MKIATFNANSIRSRLPILLDWLAAHQPDVLGIQETKCQDEDFPKEAIKAAGYHAVFRGEKSYNGVALICKSEPTDVRFGFDDGGPADETRLIRAMVDGVAVVNTYVPQGRAIDHVMYMYKLGWYARLKKLFETEYSADRPLAWIGDINIAVEPIDVNNPAGKKNDPCYHVDAHNAFLEVCSFGFTDVFRKHHPDEEIYSFFDYRVKNAIERNLGWRIDYVLTTDPLTAKCRSCEIDLEPRKKEKPSDHTFMIAEFGA
ncbi:exodeoxyribonuclease III [Pontiella sp.]|uniref:exodeoxyribonuclease III n=1 Tax=Pontiella sp. TaxID=2837462 RepID=UPI0035689D77